MTCKNRVTADEVDHDSSEEQPVEQPRHSSATPELPAEMLGAPTSIIRLAPSVLHAVATLQKAAMAAPVATRSCCLRMKQLDGCRCLKDHMTAAVQARKSLEKKF